MISRPDGRLATFSSPGQPDRPVALKRRELPELLAEELRRLDEDDVYAATVKRMAQHRERRAAATKKTAKKTAKNAAQAGREGDRHEVGPHPEGLRERTRGPPARLPQGLADGSPPPWSPTLARRAGRGPASPQIALTGGTIADASTARSPTSRAGTDVDWSRVEFWWGDERFVAADDPDRNAGQAARGPPRPRAARPRPGARDAGVRRRLRRRLRTPPRRTPTRCATPRAPAGSTW